MVMRSADAVSSGMLRAADTSGLMAPPKMTMPAGLSVSGEGAGKRSESVSIRTSPNGEKPAISNATMLPAISRVASLRQRVTASTHPSNPASAIKFDGKRKNPAIFDAMKNIPARLMAGLFAPKHREHDIGRVFDQRQQRT